MHTFKPLHAALLLALYGPLVAVAADVPATQSMQQMTAVREVHHDTSPPLRDMIRNLPQPVVTNPAEYVVPNIFLDLDDMAPGEQLGPIPPVQRSVSGTPTPATIVAANGMRIGLGGGGVPPDTTGDIGPNHYFQWVNTSWALFNKTTGAIVDIPGDADDVVPGNSFFAGFGGLCQTTNNGDPLVLWDGHARRWVVSQFAFASTTVAPFLQCMAVSATEDPLGAYHRYAFSYPLFNDYGKMGVWTTEDGGQDAYVLSMHEFGAQFAGSSFALVERRRMLQGLSAQFIRFGAIDTFGAIPFHLEGDNPLPAGMCPAFVHFSSSGPGYDLWDVCVNWAAGTAQFNPTPTFVESEPFVIGLNDIPQLSSTTRLDDFGGNTMYLAAIRSFGETGPAEAQGVINHAVNVGSNQAGARWVNFGFTPGPAAPRGTDVFSSGFEIGEFQDNSVPAVVSSKRVVDEGTYAPDGHSRWMGGINMDRSGNIMFGYNVSSATLNPEIRLAGRLRNDPAGTLRAESQCSPTGTGAQTGLFSGRARWGDYATMGVDPADECTFWFTNEYYATTSNSSWNTRICSVKFPTCGDADFLLETTPTGQIAVCGSNAVGSVRVGEFGTLGGSVTLSQGTVPAGVTMSFGTPSLAAGASSTVTLNGSAALANGIYSAQVNGVAGALNRSASFNFGVSATTAPAPNLTSPASAGTGVVTRPTFTWAAAAGAVTYFVEVSTNVGFTQVIDSGTVNGTTFTSQVLLNSNTQYFWRVRPSNFCGAGTVSAVRSFTTGVPGSCPAGTNPTQVFSDDISGDAIAWTTQTDQGLAVSAWNKVVPPAGTGITTRAWYATNSEPTGDQRLISPVIALPANQSPLILAFDAFHRYETDGVNDCWDGGFVEYSTDGGTNWLPLGNQRNLADPYPGQLSSGNPASPNQAWCRHPAGGNSVRSIFLLDGFAGGNIRLRFRSTSDSNAVGPTPNGWAVDNVLVQGCN